MTYPQKSNRMIASTCMGGKYMDDTSQKIIDATMSLIRDKGYSATTTKDIAHLAGVSECTLFRKFPGKKDIVIHGVSQEKWRANVTSELFQNLQWELEPDLEMFMNTYMNQITPDFVKLSIGLRSPQLYEETAPYIMKVPLAFLTSLTDYFSKMKDMGKIESDDLENLAITIFSATFGYTFLKASFEDNLTQTNREEFIKSSVKTFVKGLSKPQINTNAAT